MLEIKNLDVVISENQNKIVKSLNLEIGKAQIHFLLGKNGTGKSSMAMALAGNPEYEITEGQVKLDGIDIKDIPSNEKVAKGLFLSFQNPVSIAGLSVSNFLKYAINSTLKEQGKKPLNAPEFFKRIKEYSEVLEIPSEWLKRELNVGFSGGEKKKIEMLQMLMLEPKLAILDEPDSGVDVDAVKIVAKAVDYMKEKFGTSFLIITHYDKLLSLLDVDRVNIFSDGHIVKSGGHDLAEQIHKDGYDVVLDLD